MKRHYTYATPEEALDAFDQLSSGEHLAMRNYALKYIRGTRFSDSKDLISEALCRTLDGRRKWPKEIAFGLYLCMAIKSIADSERNLIENLPGMRITMEQAEQFHLDEMPTMPSAQEEMETMEQMINSAKLTDSVRLEMAGDQIGLIVLESINVGQTQTSACEAYGLTENTYQAARRRVIRKYQKLAKN